MVGFFKGRKIMFLKAKHGGKGIKLCARPVVTLLQIMGSLTFHFEEKEKPSLTVEIFPGESILDVALDNEVPLNHNCGGVCGCSTCHVYIEQGEDLLPEMSDREEDYVDRARNPRYNSRLACQCKLSEEGNLVVTIPDQSGIIGH
jgi:2Fe-2S ferredoxin